MSGYMVMNLMADFQEISSPLEDCKTHPPYLKIQGKEKVKLKIKPFNFDIIKSKDWVKD